MRSLLFCTLLGVFLHSSAVASIVGVDIARASNGLIGVTVHRETGQFSIETPDGLPLLFAAKDGLTAYTNIRYGDDTYTTNVLHRSSLPPGLLALPIESVTELPDRVRLVSVLRNGRDSTVITQDFIPSLEGSYAYVNIVTTAEHFASRPASVGVMHMLDLMVETEDRVDVTVDGVPVVRERDWQGTEIPDGYFGEVPSSRYRIVGRLRSTSAVAPDIFVLGNWQFNGYLGTVVWEYQPSGREFIDNAVLLRWNARQVKTGESIRVSTDFGYLTFADLDLACSVDDIGLSPDSSSHVPDQATAIAYLRNTGVLPLTGVRVRVSVSPPLSLASGESDEKTLAISLASGEEATLSWLLDIASADTFATARVAFESMWPDTLKRYCAVNIDVPPVYDASLAVTCPDTIRLAVSPFGGGYVPDPFALSVIVENTGGRALSGLTAEILLPTGLVLIGTSAVQAVQPDPLQASERTLVTWTIRGILQIIDTRMPYTVVLRSADGLEDRCEGIVELAGVPDEPCIEHGVSTAGTEFHLAFLPDYVGTAGELLRVFILARDGASVRIERLGTSSINDVIIPRRGMKMLELDPSLNNIQAETVQQRGIRITSDNDITVFAGNYRDRHSDGTTVLPLHALGTRYYTAGYNWFSPWEHFLVLATEDNTRISILPSAFTSTGHPDGQPIDVVLNMGEVYYIKAKFAGDGGSLTGSRVTSDKPIAVFSGAESGWIPTQQTDPYGFLNPVMDQVIPAYALGKQYVAVPFRSRRMGDTYRVIATEDNTTVTLGDGSTMFMRYEGEWHERILHVPMRIDADKPVLVAQYANSARWDANDNEYGDGSMTFLVPTERFLGCHTFSAGMLLADPVLQPDRAIYLNTGNALDVPSTFGLLPPIFTLESWVHVMSGGPIMSQWNDGAPGTGWMLSFDAGRNRLLFQYSEAGSVLERASRDNSFFRSRWTHIAMVYDEVAGELQAFVDGVLELNVSFTQESLANAAPYRWGGSYQNNYFSGYLKEARAWRGRRTSVELTQHRDQRLGSMQWNALLGYWSFCDELKDESGLGNDLLAIGSPSPVDVWNLPRGLRCAEQVDSCFVTIIAPSDAVDAVRLNYLPIKSEDWTVLSGAAFSTVSKLVPAGMNTLETTDPRGVGALSYGFAYHDAYTAYTGYMVNRTIASVREQVVPESPVLHTPSPNPAGSSTLVRFSLSEPGRASLEIVDARGVRVKRLVDAEFAVGHHAIRVDVSDLAAQSYRLVLRSGAVYSVKPLAVVR